MLIVMNGTRNTKVQQESVIIGFESSSLHAAVF